MIEVRRVYHMVCGQWIGWTSAIEEPDYTNINARCCMCGQRLFSGHTFRIDMPREVGGPLGPTTQASVGGESTWRAQKESADVNEPVIDRGEPARKLST